MSELLNNDFENSCISNFLCRHNNHMGLLCDPFRHRHQVLNKASWTLDRCAELCKTWNVKSLRVIYLYCVLYISLGSYNFRAIFTHAWAGVDTLCSCKYFGNIDNPDPLMQYTNKTVITSIFCWSRILHEKISLYGEFMNYLKKCARHFLHLKTSFSWDDPIISTAKWVVPYKQETFVIFIPIRGKKIFSLIKSISFDIHGKVVKKGRKCDITLDLFPTKLQKNYPTRLSM